VTTLQGLQGLGEVTAALEGQAEPAVGDRQGGLELDRGPVRLD
jgi:hypothetical protein